MAIEAVAIGTSAGAIEALSKVLPPLPADYPIPIFVVVHLPPDRESVVAELFQSKCNLRVKEAEHTEVIEGGTVYFAPPDYHLLVERNRHLSLSSEEQVLFSRPSIDVLFETAADAYRETLLGIVLTGANSDGAEGLRAIAEAGGTVVVQRPESALASAMPEAALKANPQAQPLDLNEISEYLQRVVAVEQK